MIEGVEELEPKLKVCLLGEGEALEQRGIPLIDPVLAQASDHCGKRTNMVVERVGRLGVERAHVECWHARVGHAIVQHDWATEIHVVAGTSRASVGPLDRLASLIRVDAVQHPTAHQSVPYPRLEIEEPSSADWQLIGDGRHEAV